MEQRDLKTTDLRMKMYIQFTKKSLYVKTVTNSGLKIDSELSRRQTPVRALESVSLAFVGAVGILHSGVANSETH